MVHEDFLKSFHVPKNRCSICSGSGNFSLCIKQDMDLIQQERYPDFHLRNECSGRLVWISLS